MKKSKLQKQTLLYFFRKEGREGGREGEREGGRKEGRFACMSVIVWKKNYREAHPAVLTITHVSCRKEEQMCWVERQGEEKDQL